MATENGSSTLEMGTSDQDLVTPKRKKKLTYIIAVVAFLAVVGVVVALVVVLSGDNEAGDAEAIVSTTQGPTSPGSTTTPVSTTTPSTTTSPTTTTNPSTTTSPSTTTTESTTTTTTTTELPPVTQPPESQIDLEDIINGVYTPNSFNGSWTAGSEILFRNGNGDLVMYDLNTDSTTLLVQNSSQILQQSSRVTQLSPDQSHVILARNVAPIYRYSFLAQYSAINISTGDVIDITPPGVNASLAYLQNFVWGPSGTSLAFVYLNNVYYQASLTAVPVQISTNGVLNVVYHGIPDWVYEEEVFTSNNAIWFSSDGNKLAYASFNDTDVRVMRVPHYGLPGSVDFQYTKHHEIRYPKPGTTNPTVYVTLRDVATGATDTYNSPSDIEQPILKMVKFVTNNTIALMWTNRVQNQLRVVLCTALQEVCNTIFEYNEPEGWIDNIPFLFNVQGNAFITILPFAVNNSTLFKQVVQVTEGNAASEWTLSGRSNTPHTVLEILLWTPDDTIWYKATHVNDSSEQHIYSVNSAGQVSCFTCDLNQGNGDPCLYNDGAISQDGSKVTINCGGPGVPQIAVYNINGSLLRVWDDNEETAQLVNEKDLPEVIRLSVPVGDGYPDADVDIQVPFNYQNRTNVPLLVYVYGGPDTALVTKQWSIDWGTSLVTRWGIAVAHIDGRGSGLRGVNNAFAVNRRLGSVEIEDQINVTRYLHQNLTWLDSNRTCIWGWSYGGYAASLALARGDVFRCAAAVAPVVDWRFYDTIYTERYMGVPQNNSEAYAQSSLLTDEVVEAFRQKRYFLIHGTADDNVHYQHTMLLSRLLQRRDVYFQQMSYTDEQHGLSGVTPHLYHALERFLQENLL